MFENAVRQVYASTMDISALNTGDSGGLRERTNRGGPGPESIGSYYGNLYMPVAGYSYSTYKLQKDIRPDEGMLRLVRDWYRLWIGRKMITPPVNLIAPQ
ncbi:MAG: hypothetical protein ACLUOI_35920 [Eisenbergiella sp.]